MIKKEWEDIVILDWIKSLDKELISEIKELTSIKRFKAGTILSKKENIELLYEGIMFLYRQGTY